MEFCVLGPLEWPGGRAPVGKRGALLGLLLLDANRPLTSERLIEALWGEEPPRSAGNLLQGYVSGLRKTVGDRIRTVPGGYLIAVEAGELDSLRFRRLVEEGRALAGRDPERTAALLDEALSLWRGEVLAGLPVDPGVEAARLAELRLEALEARVEADLALGRHARVLGELEGLLEAEPLRERPRELLMLALYRSGRQAEALEVYRRGRALLVDELGIEPGSALRDLEQAILRQDSALELLTAAEPPSRLVAPASPFLGRERELERAMGLLGRPDVRLLTLTGTGGIGKTRLALELGRRLADGFPDGAHLVSLASVADPSLVLVTIAQTLGVPPSAAEVEPALRLYLRERSLLLLVDNFEHLLAAGPDLTELLAGAPGLKLLVTSTSLLRLSGERELVVPPLDLPDAASITDLDALSAVPSVALFVLRAQAANDEFALDGASGPVVAEICRRLEGLPLAIELAAARTTLLPPAALLERLGRRLDLLGGGARDGPARQRTLRATIDWSYDLLDPGERLLFSRLGVFAGGCTPEAAEEVCGDGGPIFEGLASLIDKSLLRSSSAGPRFAMLETQREYGLERLEQAGEAERLRDRHLEYYAALAEQAEPELKGAQQLHWYERLEAEIDNLRAAHDHALASGSSTLALRLAAALFRFWKIRGQIGEGRRWLLDALDLGGEQPARVRAKALCAAAALSLNLGLRAEARPLVDESILLYNRTSDSEGLAGATVIAGIATALDGDARAALALFRRAAADYQALGDRRSYAAALGNAGWARFIVGDYAGAAADGAEAVALVAELGDRHMVSLGLLSVGIALVELGDDSGAVTRIEEGFAIARELGLKEQLAEGLVAFAVVAASRGEHERAARLLGAHEALRETLGTPLDPFELAAHDRVIAAVGEALDQRALAAAWAEGRALDLEQALDYALGPLPDLAPDSPT